MGGGGLPKSELNLMNLIQSSKDDLKGAIMGLREKNPATGRAKLRRSCPTLVGHGLF